MAEGAMKANIMPPNTVPPGGIYDVHPNPDKVRRGRGGGSHRVFEQFLGLKPVPSKWRCHVPPGCRLAKPCRDTPAATLIP